MTVRTSHNPLRRRHRLWMLAGVVLMLPSWLDAQEAPSRTHERFVAPIAFNPGSNAANYVVEAGGLGRLCTFKGAGYFVAPLYFDDGTTIERITVLIEDSNRDGIGMMSLARRGGAQSLEVLATTPISVGTKEIESLSTAAISAPLIDNQWGAYLLQVVLTAPGVCLHGAQVTYRSP